MGREKRIGYRRAELRELPGVLAEDLEEVRFWGCRLELEETYLADARLNGNEFLIQAHEQKVKEIKEILAVMQAAADKTNRRIQQWLR